MKNPKNIAILVVLLVTMGGVWFSLSPGSKNLDMILEGEEKAELESEETSDSAEGTKEVPEETGDSGFGNESSPETPVEWLTYTNAEWKYSFKYPKGYELIESPDGFRVTLTPPGEVEKVRNFFSVIVIQYPEVKSRSAIPKTLFHQANFPNGELAWLKPPHAFKYEENYLIGTQEITFGINNNFAFKVRETSINENLGEYRSLVYVLRDPAVYRVTHDLLAAQTYGDIIREIEDSFEVMP